MLHASGPNPSTAERSKLPGLTSLCTRPALWQHSMPDTMQWKSFWQHKAQRAAAASTSKQGQSKLCFAFIHLIKASWKEPPGAYSCQAKLAV